MLRSIGRIIVESGERGNLEEDLRVKTSSGDITEVRRWEDASLKPKES